MAIKINSIYIRMVQCSKAAAILLIIVANKPNPKASMEDAMTMFTRVCSFIGHSKILMKRGRKNFGENQNMK